MEIANGKKIVLKKVTNCLKGEKLILARDDISIQQKKEEIKTIRKLMIVINNFDAVAPIIEKYVNDTRERELDER